MSGTFLKKIFIVIAPVLIIVLIWEYNLRKMPTSHTSKKAFLEKHLSDTELLIVGSSHAHHGIDPKFFKRKTFNLANVSQSLYYDKKLVELYLPKLKKLKAVIIPVSYFSLEFSLRDSGEYWRTFFYAMTYGIPLEDTPFYEFDIRSYSLIALYSRKTALAYTYSQYTTPLTHVEPRGWESLNGNGNCDYGEPRVKFHTSIMQSNRVPYSVRQLDELLNLLKKYHIKSLLVTTPVCPSYAKNMDPQKYKVMQKNIDVLHRKYNVPYYNFSTDKRFESADFIDDHLNPQGAKKFSLILSDTVESVYKPK